MYIMRRNHFRDLELQMAGKGKETGREGEGNGQGNIEGRFFRNLFIYLFHIARHIRHNERLLYARVSTHE